MKTKLKVSNAKKKNKKRVNFAHKLCGFSLELGKLGVSGSFRVKIR